MGVSVGDAIKVFWPHDKEYYSARIAAYNRSTGTHCVQYDDGEVEDLNLTDERWRLVHTQLDPESSKPSNVVIKHDVKSTPPTPTSITAQVATLHQRSVGSTGGGSRRSTRNTKRKLSYLSSGSAKKKRTAVPTRASAPLSRKEHSSSLELVPARSAAVSKPTDSPVTKDFRASHRLVEICVDSWLGSKLRRMYKTSMFSVNSCLNHVLDMLLIALTCPRYNQKLFRNKDNLFESWLMLDGENLSSRRRAEMTLDEWAHEKKLLSSISKLLQEADDAALKKNHDNDLVEAAALVMFARGCLRGKGVNKVTKT